MKQTTIVIGDDLYIIAELPADIAYVTIHHSKEIKCSKVLFSSEQPDFNRCSGGKLTIGSRVSMIGRIEDIEPDLLARLTEKLITAGLYLENPAGQNWPFLCPGDEMASMATQAHWEALEARTFRSSRSYVFHIV